MSCRRFYRDVGMRGWTGGADGTKVMMFELDMPHCGQATCNWDRPAVWALNARVSEVQPGCELRHVEVCIELSRGVLVRGEAFADRG